MDYNLTTVEFVDAVTGERRTVRFFLTMHLTDDEIREQLLVDEFAAREVVSIHRKMADVDGESHTCGEADCPNGCTDPKPSPPVPRTEKVAEEDLESLAPASEEEFSR